PNLGSFGNLIERQPDADNDWRSGCFDTSTLDRMPTADLLNLLSNLSPDLSRALWDFLRMTNPGHEVKAYGRDGKTVDARAQASVEAFVARLNARYGSIDVVIHRLFINAFLRGAFFAELVLDKRGRLALDIATPDSRYLYFDRHVDPVLGPIWRPFQFQGGVRKYLDLPTIRYVPVDPLPGSPYGRAPAAPALFTIIFAMGLLHDLRRVVSQQGYPRLDISMDLDALLKKMPPEAAASNTERQAWLQSVLTGIQTHIAQLQPEDTFVHTSDIVMNRPVGTVDSSSLGGVDALLATLDRMALRALKSLPILFGISDGVSEANANRQYEIFIQGLKALQHLAEGMLEYFLTLALQAEGLQATVEWRFSEARAAEMLRDAQTSQLVMQNAMYKYQAGWISQDEAAHEGADRDKADVPEPRALSSVFKPEGGSVNPAAVQADPGANRAQSVNGNGHLDLKALEN
ncbi:MAG: hypothetical protein H0U60_20240, partial [Blastocatellia bacterium]|nr:hypothetical protein [Blastocatellia bacterium]